MNSFWKIAVGCLAVALAACGPRVDQPLDATESPVPLAVPASPTAHIPTVVVPTPSSESGVVTGRIIVALTGEPMAGVRVYLANRVFLTPGPDYVLSLTDESSPHATADADGFFAIAAPPKNYALVVWTALDSKVVADPADNTKEIDVNVVANRTLELGDLVVNWP